MMHGKIEAGELRARFDAFARGDWSDLLAAARQSTTRERQSQSGTSTSSAGDLAQRACDKVRLEECTRARQILTASPLAPGNAETLNELSDPQKRPPRALAPIPPEVLQFEPTSAVAIPFNLFVSCLLSAPRGSSGVPGSTTYEHLKVALDDEDTAALLHKACERLARAHAPVDTTRAFMQANLTALVKKNGKVRGIATGTSLRRLVARCLAKQYGPAIEEACAPFQYALSTRAGTDCVGHLLRAATDLGSNSTILSIDGVGAYDHIRRATMLENLCPCLEPRPYFPGSGFRTRNLPHTCGGTIRGWCTTYLRARAESKATPLCLCSLLWASTIHSRRSRPTSSRMNTFALFWTTSILSVLLKELGPFSIYCNDICTR